MPRKSDRLEAYVSSCVRFIVVLPPYPSDIYHHAGAPQSPLPPPPSASVLGLPVLPSTACSVKDSIVYTAVSCGSVRGNRAMRHPRLHSDAARTNVFRRAVSPKTCHLPATQPNFLPATNAFSPPRCTHRISTPVHPSFASRQSTFLFFLAREFFFFVHLFLYTAPCSSSFYWCRPFISFFCPDQEGTHIAICVS